MANKKKAKKGGGGKLTRSEIVQVRLDPKLKFAAELAARKQRRTLSSFIEWVVDQAVKKEPISPDPKNSLTIYEAAESVWDFDEAIRFVRLAREYPILLTYEEELLWKLICDTQRCWVLPKDMKKGRTIEKTDLRLMDLNVLKKEFKSFKEEVNGELDRIELIKRLTQARKIEMELPF